MEKEHQAESMTTIPIKPEYPPSEIYGSEAPPAYQRPKSTAVQVAKIVAVTIILVSFILGGFILASSYVTANATYRQLEQEMQLLSDTADKFQGVSQPEALIQEEPIQKEASSDALRSEQKVKEIQDNVIPQETEDSKDDPKEAEPVEINENSTENDSSEENGPSSQFPFDIDQIIGALIDKNQRSKMNCIVEKKRAEEVVDHQPKTIRLPFGVNLTTDPRYEHLTGERMVIICESGKMQRTIPIPPQARPQQQEPEQSEEDPDDSEETIMIQPVVIPIGPINPFQTHMPQQMRPMIRPLPAQIQPEPQMQHRFPQIQMQRQIEIQMQPQPQIQPQPQMRPQPQMMHTMSIPQQIQIIPLTPPQAPPQMMQVPQVPQPMETLRPPRPEQPEPQQYSETVLPPYHVMQQIAQQILNQRLQMEAQRAQEENMRRYAAQQAAERAAQEEARREALQREEEARRAAAIDAARREDEARRAAAMEAAQREEARRVAMLEAAQRAAQIAAAQEAAQRAAQEESRRVAIEQAREDAARRAAAHEAVQRAVQEAAQRAIAQAAAQRAAQEAAQRNAEQDDDTKEDDSQPSVEQRPPVQHIPIMMPHRIPIPEEVLRHINKLPNHEVIVQVTEERPDSEETREVRLMPQENEVPQEIARLIPVPVHIPVPMMRQETQEEPQQQVEQQEVPQQQQEQAQQQQQQPEEQSQPEVQEPQAQASSEGAQAIRPHFVQPRSV